MAPATMKNTPQPRRSVSIRMAATIPPRPGSRRRACASLGARGARVPAGRGRARAPQRLARSSAHEGVASPKVLAVIEPVLEPSAPGRIPVLDRVGRRPRHPLPRVPDRRRAPPGPRPGQHAPGGSAGVGQARALEPGPARRAGGRDGRRPPPAHSRSRARSCTARTPTPTRSPPSRSSSSPRSTADVPAAPRRRAARDDAGGPRRHRGSSRRRPVSPRAAGVGPRAARPRHGAHGRDRASRAPRSPVAAAQPARLSRPCERRRKARCRVHPWHAPAPGG